MSAISSIALSGLNAATLRVQAAASNLANARSNGAVRGEAILGNEGPEPYAPVEVHQQAITTGGVAAQLAPSSREPLLTYDPSAPYANAEGFVASPDIDPADEVVALAMATYSFSANLAVIRTESEMMDALLNSKSVDTRA
jgi:flagellar basal-body rod protein FlgC